MPTVVAVVLPEDMQPHEAGRVTCHVTCVVGDPWMIAVDVPRATLRPVSFERAAGVLGRLTQTTHAATAPRRVSRLVGGGRVCMPRAGTESRGIPQRGESHPLPIGGPCLHEIGVPENLAGRAMTLRCTCKRYLTPQVIEVATAAR